MRLSQLKSGQQAKIAHIHHLHQQKDQIAGRLMRLGFVPGEQVEIITRGFFGGEPLLVKVGFSRFALRRNEADRIEIQQP